MRWLALGLTIAVLCMGCWRCKNDELPELEVEFRGRAEVPELVNSSFMDQQQFFNGLSLPFLLSSDRSSYTFTTAEGREEVLVLQYKRQTDFENNECSLYLIIQGLEVLPETSYTNVQAERTERGWRVSILE
jgi:hypothetical protein